MSDWEDDYDADGGVKVKSAPTVQQSEWRPQSSKGKENVCFEVKRGQPAALGRSDQDGPPWRNWRDKADTCGRDFRNGDRDAGRKGRGQTVGTGSGSPLSFAVDNSMIGRVIGELEDLKLWSLYKLASSQLTS